VLDVLRTIVETNLPRLSIRSTRGNQLADIFFSALGKDFFQSPIYRTNPVTREREISHPLVRGLLSHHEPEIGVSEALELGLYLEALCFDPKISSCISCLRVPFQYESTFFQLAMSYRIKQICTEMSLEPETLRGRADIAFTFEGASYVAECYRVNRTIWDYMGDFELELFPNVDKLVPSGRKYAYTLKLDSILTFHSMRDILRRFKTMLTEFNSRNELTKIELRHNNVLLGVEDLTNVETDPDFSLDNQGNVRRARYLDADGVWVTYGITAANIFVDLNSPMTDTSRGNRLIVWRNYKKQYVKSAYDILESKAARKLRQTRPKDGNARRILLVEFPCSLFFRGQLKPIHRTIQNRAVRTIHQLAAIILAERQALKENRFSYQGLCLLGQDEYAVPNSFLDRFNKVETSNFF
jgi:hypothetical protein